MDIVPQSNFNDMVICPSAIGEFILRPLSLRVRWNKRLVTALYLGKVGYHGIDEPPVARYENLWTGYCGIAHYTDTVAEWLEGNDLCVWEPDTLSRTSEKDVLVHYKYPPVINMDTLGIQQPDS